MQAKLSFIFHTQRFRSAQLSNQWRVNLESNLDATRVQAKMYYTILFSNFPYLTQRIQYK